MTSRYFFLLSVGLCLLHSLTYSSATADMLSEQQVHCYQLADRIPDLPMEACLDGDLVASGYSVMQRPLYSKDFPPVSGIEPNGRVLVVGGTHGDEWSSISQTYAWLALLNRRHQGQFHWRFIPVLNPDGALASPPTRTNHNNVDLNRNMSVLEGAKTPLQYWQQTGQKNRRYPGTPPLSEPESQWLATQIEAFQPDVIISLHAPLGMVDFDGSNHHHPHITPPHHLGHLALRDLRAYPGSLGNYAGVQRGIPVVTIELRDSRRMPNAKRSERLWVDVVRWLRVSLSDH